MYKPHKYKPVSKVIMKRNWPEREIHQAPLWCSVDLRDGNQALPNPMNIEAKIDFFKLLITCGFKEIEVGFPAAAAIEYNFVRTLIAHKFIPTDVRMQVLTQIKEEQIKQSIQSLVGTTDQIVHMYNSTSPLQRELVFKRSPQETIALAVQGVAWIKHYQTLYNTPVILEYSPESFSATELEFARDICNTVIAAWQPTPKRKMIINLPATVEGSTPNHYADQVEWMINNLNDRESLIISVHTHNDRGCAVAAAELALLAGAERIEGTLFGNGERSGNADLITLAMNLYTHGIDNKLNFENLPQICTAYTQHTGMDIPRRQPYSGAMIYTAYSGSHQDAIHKGLHYQQTHAGYWQVPYLPLDPHDVAMTSDLIKFTSQSGRGGLRYIIEQTLGISADETIVQALYPQLQGLSEHTEQEIAAPYIAELYLEKLRTSII